MFGPQPGHADTKCLGLRAADEPPQETPLSSLIPLNRPMRWFVSWASAVALAVAIVSVALLTLSTSTISAAPVEQCNSEQNAGTQGIRCTTTVVNYLTATGALSAAPLSTVTTKRCVGTAAQINVNAGTCTTTTTISTTPAPAPPPTSSVNLSPPAAAAQP